MSTTVRPDLQPSASHWRAGTAVSAGGRSRVRELVGARAEIAALVAFLAAIAAAFTVRLGSVVVSDMDEGTYLYAGKLLAAGLIPYRDFLLAHPPLVVAMAAAWESFAGSDIIAARFAYMAVVLISTIPLYVLTRELAGSRLAGLLSIAAYTTGMLLLANMGRTVRLEPIMNAFLVAGAAGYLLRPDSRAMRLLVGALLACALLVKLVAAVPIALLFIADLLFVHRDRRTLVRWLDVALGAAVVLVPTFSWLLAQPGFIDDVIRSQIDRPGLPLATRAYFLWQDFTRYPIIPLALLAAVWLAARTSDARIRVVAVLGLLSTIALVAAFRTFFGYYLVQVLPWLALLFAVACVGIVRRLVGRWRAVTLSLVMVLGLAVPIGYAEYYARTAHDHVSSPAAIVPLLREGSGYIYTMYPSFALWSNRPIYPWYFQADALVPRLDGRLSDDGFIEAFAGSEALVLYADELADYPRAQQYVEEHFHLVRDDSFYSLWVR